MSSTFPRLFLVASLLILSQLAGRWWNASNQPAGRDRGDFELQAGVLPEQVAGWTLVGFRKTDPAKRRLLFSSHIWNYTSSSSLTANVSFDQANWKDWHELTECYCNAGWELLSRKLQITDDNPDWPFVVATLRKNDAHAALVFSMAFRDGKILIPPDLTASQATAATATDRFAARTKLQDRQGHSDPSMLAVQHQVLATFSQPLNPEQVRQAIDLHRSTRQIVQTSMGP